MGQKRRFDRAAVTFAVGTRVTSRPPDHRGQSPAPDSHRTWRADLPHHALRQLVHSTASTLQLPIWEAQFWFQQRCPLFDLVEGVPSEATACPAAAAQHLSPVTIVFASAEVSLRYPNPFRRSLHYEIQHWPRFPNSSARQLVAEASVNSRRIVTRLLQTMRSTSDADDNLARCLRRPPHHLRVSGCRFHFRNSFDSGSMTDVAALGSR